MKTSTILNTKFIFVNSTKDVVFTEGKNGAMVTKKKISPKRTTSLSANVSDFHPININRDFPKCFH